MNSKGPSHVDPDLAERATSRRGWLGAAGAAGLLGAVAVLLSDGPAAAAPDAPDLTLLAAAQELEVTASDLYQLAIDAGIDDPDGVIATIAANHRAYAEAIAGLTGISANTRNDEVFDSLQAGFDTTDVAAFSATARDLENIATATHTELLGMYQHEQAISLSASILAVTARHATVLGDMSGDSDDALLSASGTPADTSTGESS